MTPRNTLLSITLTISILFTIFGGLMAQEGGPKTRDQIQDKYKWNLDEIYTNKVAWEKDFKLIETVYMPKLSEFKGKLSGAENVLACLKLKDEAGRTLDKLQVYIHMKLDEDQSDNDIQELASRCDSMSARMSESLAYIRPELLTLSEDTLRGFMKQPGFEDYRHSIDALIRIKAHTLSRAEEELLASSADMAGTFVDTYNKLRLVDMTFPVIQDDKGKDIQLTPGVYQQILESKNRDYRKRAFLGMYSSYDKSKNTLASLLSASVKKDIFYAHAWKFKSALEASLFDEFVPESVFDNLVQSVNGNLKYLHRYTQLRKKVLKIDKVHVYDMYVSLVDNFDKKVPYEDAKKMIPLALTPLGKEYITAFQKGLESRWVDVYETKNKNTGGYNWGSYDTHPYILMNYNDTVDSMQTLAHEMGHAMNSYYTHAAQKYVNSETPIFNAEVASTANETLSMRYLVANAKSDEEKLFYINQQIDDIKNTVYVQTMYSEFEKLIHERVEKGEALSVKSFNSIWKDLMEKYFGEEFVTDDLAPLWWSRIPHFYRSFYVYKYATSLAASHELVRQMTEGPKPDEARKRYLEFLAAGSSDYPIEVLKKAGVDMNSPQAVNDVLAEFGTLVEEMEKLLKKMGKI